MPKRAEPDHPNKSRLIPGSSSASNPGTKRTAATDEERTNFTGDPPDEEEAPAVMLVVDNELVLDLTEEQEDYHVVLKRAREQVLNSDIHEFTLVSHLSRNFPVRDLAEILQNTYNLEILSLFSIALSGRTKDFEFFAGVLRGHKQLKEVHMVDCGMLGAWEVPPGSESSVGTDASKLGKHRPPRPPRGGTATRAQPPSKDPTVATTDVSSAALTTMSTSGGTAKSTSGATGVSGGADTSIGKSTSGATAGSKSGGTSLMSTTTSAVASMQSPPSVAATAAAKSKKRSAPTSSASPVLKKATKVTATPSVASKGDSSATASIAVKEKVPTMDAILNALATIETLTNVELYGIPLGRFDKESDGDQESDHRAILKEGEGDQDIPMVPMALNDSVTHSDEDFMDDYDEDIRGIPGNARPGCSTTKNLSLLMSPESVGTLCRGPSLTNIGLEDLDLQPKHIEQIAEALSAKESKVKELKMWGCSIDDVSAISLAKMLKVNSTLEKLDLSYNHVGDEGCIAIAKALRENKSLQCLNIMGNECAEDYDKESRGGCYEALMDLLQHNKTLKDLILEPFEQDDSVDDIPEFITIPANFSFQADDASSASE